MLVSELKPGMLLLPAGDNEVWAVYGGQSFEDVGEKWLTVQIKGWARDKGTRPEGPVLYLGTKRDLKLNVKWTNKFVLVNNEIHGVDPASWKRIKPVEGQ